MTVVHAAASYFPDTLGGTEVYVAALARHAAAAGHDVTVAAPDPGGDRERTYLYDGTPVYRYPTTAAPTRAEVNDDVAVRGAERFHAYLARRQPDVVHLHTFTTALGPFEVDAARASGAAVVVTTHSSRLGWICQRGTLMRWGEALCDGLATPAKCAACVLQARGVPKPTARALGHVPPALSRRLGAAPGPLGTAFGMPDRIVRNLEKQAAMLGAVDRFVVLTEWARQAMLRNGAPPKTVVLNRLGAAGTYATKPDTPTQRPVRVGLLSRFEKIKGTHVLARAVASLPPNVEIEVEMRGPGHENGQGMAELREILRDEPRVRFAPPVSPDKVAGVLAGYDVLCCPSLCLEGGPTVVLEAFGVGTPVVGSRIGGIAEMVTDGVTGRLVPPGDAPALAAVFAEVARDPAGTVDRWRANLPAPRTMADVSDDYLALYADVRRGAAALPC